MAGDRFSSVPGIDPKMGNKINARLFLSVSSSQLAVSDPNKSISLFPECLLLFWRLLFEMEGERGGVLFTWTDLLLRTFFFLRPVKESTGDDPNFLT